MAGWCCVLWPVSVRIFGNLYHSTFPNLPNMERKVVLWCLRNQIKPKQDSEGFTVFHSLTSKIGWLVSNSNPQPQPSIFFQQTAAVNIKGISSRSGTRCFLKKGPHLKQQSLRFKKLLCQTGDVAFEALKGSLHNTAERKDWTQSKVSTSTLPAENLCKWHSGNVHKWFLAIFMFI